MKNYLFIFAWLISFGTNVNAKAQRLLETGFAGVDSIVDIPYGNAPDYRGNNQVLYFDFYEPQHDDAVKRPLLIYAHGGGFTGGTRKWPSIKKICEKMAARGYAVASISYRLTPGFHIFQSDDDRRAMTDAMHDMRAAIRFFKANHATYRIDTSNIFITGESAGAVTAMMAGYVDKQQELAAYPGTTPNNVEGNSGNSGYSASVKGVACLCGFIQDTTAIGSGADAPLLWVHGSSDPMVPISLAEPIIERAKNVGLQYEKIIFDNATHCPWYYGLPKWPEYLDSLVNYLSHFIYPLVTGKTAPTLQRAKVPTLKLANLLQSNMVVQQKKPFRIWGTAAANSQVVLQADWTGRKTTAQADDRGNWSGTIKVPAAKKGNFDPHTITIVSGDDTAKLTNILIGEVWIGAGQSNMDMPVGKIEGWYPGVLNWEQEVAGANYPAIRLFKVHAAFKITPQDDAKGNWVVCSPETVKGFSAVAYFFGRELFKTMDIPVGLVVTAAAGASAQAFTPREVLEADPVLKEHHLDPYLKEIATQEKVDSLGFFTQVTRPYLIYNAMIHPLENLSIRGFIWYQGESNIPDKGRYTHLAGAMLKSWRYNFKQGQLPFYFSQIAPCISTPDASGTASGFLREAQHALLKVNNTGWAVTTDVGEEKNVHPQDKKAVGVRLAKSALHQTYGLRNLPYRGPEYASMKIVGDTVRISFNPHRLATALRTADGQPPRGFYVAGRDKKFYEAKARIVNNQVWLYAEEVKEPVAVRYAFMNWVHTNLQNEDGLPAVPFRTDNWE